MDIDVFPAHELPTVLRVLRTSLADDGPLDARERAFLDTYAAIVSQPRDGTDPPRIDADDVRIAGAHARKRLVQLAALAVMLNRPMRTGPVLYLRTLSRALATHDTVVDVVEALHLGQHRRVRLLTLRRMMRVMLAEAYRAEGWRGVLRLIGAMALGAPVNRDRRRDFQRLGLLPEGSLGREYWKHMTTLGFGFPGEPGGIAGSVAYHDVVHVLAGHDTTPAGEMQQASFQGGNRRDDGFFFIQFAVLQFHQGVRITPATPAQVGHFEPEALLWAIQRGALCPVDTTHQWDYWPLLALPLDEARERLGVRPPPRRFSGTVFSASEA